MPTAEIKQHIDKPVSLLRGSITLFFMQIFSTLSYSVLYSTLILYTTEKLHIPDHTATGITATFIAFNYGLHLLGGYFGGRLLSYRALFAIGMLMQILGCLLISIPSINALYWGLAAFLSGAGLNVICINCMLTQLFRPDDKRRETAFLWNYSGMNIGFFIGFSVSGYLQLQSAFHELFLLSSAGNVIALIMVLVNWRILKDLNTILVSVGTRERLTRNIIGVIGIFALFLVLVWFLKHPAFSKHIVLTAGILMAGVITYIGSQQPSSEARYKIYAYLILAIMSVVFWMLYQMAPMGLNLFIDRNVDRTLWGMVIPPQWIQNINTIVIVFIGPLLGWVFYSLRKRGFKVTIPLQFSIGLLLIGVGYAILPLGIQHANAAGLTAFIWIVLCYILQSLAELFISPIGYAMVGELAPQKLQAIFMGTWMMISGVASTLSGMFSQAGLGYENTVNPLVTNHSFSHTFGTLGTISICSALILCCLMPFLGRLLRK